MGSVKISVAAKKAAAGSSVQVVIRGGNAVGSTIKATPGDDWTWETGTWKRDGVAIASSTTYIRQKIDIGKKLTFTPDNPVPAVVAGDTQAKEPERPVVKSASFSVVNGVGEINVLIDPPEDNGSPVKEFKAFLDDGSTAVSDTVNMKIPNRKAGAALSLMVRALNDIGYSLASFGVPIIARKPETLRQVATRSQVSNTKVGSPQVLGGTKHRAMDSMKSIMLGYMQAYGQDESVLGLNYQTYKVFVEYPIGSGKGCYVTWNNGASIVGTINKGTVGFSDLTPLIDRDTGLPFTIPKYAFFRLRSYFTAPGGVVVSRGSAALTTYDASVDMFQYANDMNTSLDKTGVDSATWGALTTTYDSTLGYCTKPAAILSMSSVDSYALLGDSRAALETADTPDAITGVCEHMERIWGNAFAFINLAAAGEKGLAWANMASTTMLRRQFLKFCTRIAYGYGTNDVTNAASQEIMNSYPAIVKGQPDIVGKVFEGVNLPPYVTSGPSGATYYTSLTGQNLSGQEAIRLGYNAFVLANTGPGKLFDRSFDLAPYYTDDSTGVARWRVYANTRTLTGDVDANGLITLTSGVFVAEDGFHSIRSPGWSFTANLYGTPLTYRTAGTSCRIKLIDATHAQAVNAFGNPQSPVAAATGISFLMGINDETNDGIHGGRRPAERMMAAIGLPVTEGIVGAFAPYMGPICQRNRLANAFANTGTIREMQSWGFRDSTSFVPAGQEIEVEYTNVLGVGELLDAPGNLTCSIEYPQGVFTQFLCNGVAQGTMSGSGSRVFFKGRLAVDLPKHARFWISTWVRWTGTYALYGTYGVNKFADFRDRNREATSFSNTTVADTTMTGVRSTTDQTGWGFHPVAIRSMTTEATFGIIDDSQGLSSALNWANADDFGLIGLDERRLKGCGSINLSISGDSYAEALVKSKFVIRAAILQGLPFIMTGLGENDGPLSWALLSGTYDPQLKAMFPGALFGRSTLDARTTSTDNFMTIAGQSAAANWTARAEINANLRAGVSPIYDFILDDAAQIEATPGGFASKISPAAAFVTYNGTLAANSTGLTNMPPGTFSRESHDMHQIFIPGAGAAGANFVATMRYVSPTEVKFITITSSGWNNAKTGSAVTNPVLSINANDYVVDGIHRALWGEVLNTGKLSQSLLALM